MPRLSAAGHHHVTARRRVGDREAASMTDRLQGRLPTPDLSLGGP